ncbi:imidazole glycerol phosphate synthase subunit HisH [Oceanobacillus profundus]|uniref:imidazole glycerol phosphate synthase subunit HisH n=1 Tax=Oceanobacillus TaxID=182709 RepID=UPI0020402C3D|nr:imidazole glycerol phosphate synthase subunit HisH [Oceanobacillus profundus]MBR3118464.1 imidazole glycerol phosphate synthase subunit HisH [Oceanobacillus sp.]MCM3398987.1 imidazole glycerol phosphate synthase subunit HisH [Oceanobacillus profundus]MDO6450651.1 imidazole glycerol phosphate synthase subunit HisH [Oceanobacillus profundus]
MIAIIDYGAGNIKSLQFALAKLNKESVLTTDPQVIRNASSIILPGVGAFKDAMDAIKKIGLSDVIKQEVQAGKPILGICLGMQLFYDKSYEDGDWDGLGLLKGNVSRIKETVKVPHMGWNTITKHNKSLLTLHLPDDFYVYFVHSYAVEELEEATLVGSTEYGGRIPAIVQQGNITGMQFHPEKSGDIGIQLLANYEEMIS